MKRIALIPARKGSKRIKDKNIRLLNGLPLIAYSIIAAKKAKLFDKIFVITDSKKYLDIGKKYGADLFKLRPSKISTSESPDISWLLWFAKNYKNFSKLPTLASCTRSDCIFLNLLYKITKNKFDIPNFKIT